MLVYRGLAVGDLGIETCRGSFALPVKYAYQVVGEVVETGPGAPYEVGDVVFARHPHQTLFTMNASENMMVPVPTALDPERAAFMNLLTVALTACLDVPIRYGDVVLVYGLGIVGSFAAQLARRTAGTLIVVDPIQARRDRAVSLGADHGVAPGDEGDLIADITSGRGADIAIESSGAGAGLQAAIRNTGQEGTIVALGFYGHQPVPLVLAPEFHYRRQRIVSSMVAAIGSGLQPRWTRRRKDEVALGLLLEKWIETPVSHRFAFSESPSAYELLDQQGDTTTGVLFDYRGDGSA
jgi:threonine dehydrogenase-like Zn-dependent dehydrogenase